MNNIDRAKSSKPRQYLLTVFKFFILIKISSHSDLIWRTTDKNGYIHHKWVSFGVIESPNGDESAWSPFVLIVGPISISWRWMPELQSFKFGAKTLNF